MKNILWLKDFLTEEGTLYKYQQGILQSQEIKLDQAFLGGLTCDELIVLFPSELTNSRAFTSPATNEEKRLAIFLSQFGHEIIDEPSELYFHYSKTGSCYYWAKTHALNNLFIKLDALDIKVIALPDFFLLPAGQTSAIIIEDRILIRLSNGEGFALSVAELGYIETFFSKDVLAQLALTPNTKAFGKNDKRVLEELDANLILDGLDVNFYRNPLTISRILHWLHLSKKQALAMAGVLLLSYIFLSFESWNLKNNIAITKADTEKIFSEINPSFSKLVNAKAQIDNLLGEVVPPKQDVILKENLRKISTLLSAFNIPKLTYKPSLGTVTVTLNQMNSINLNLLKQAVASFNFKIDISNLTADASGYYSGEVHVYL